MQPSELEIPKRWSARGQWRYNCPCKWPDGAQCVFDTYSVELILQHIAQTHNVQEQAQATSGHLFSAGDAKADDINDMEKQVDAGPKKRGGAKRTSGIILPGDDTSP